jgi:tRNA-dihydrouridine synthase A
LLAELQRELFNTCGVASRKEAVEDMTDYIKREVATGVPVKHISRHLLGLFQGLPGARRWRRFISEHAHLDPANDRLLLQAMEHMRKGIAVAPGSARVHGNALE